MAAHVLHLLWIGATLSCTFACSQSVELFADRAEVRAPGDMSPDIGRPDDRPLSTLGLSLGEYHSCAVRDGRVTCWGLNTDGQLGARLGPDVLSPTAIGEDSDWVEVECGERHSCGRKRDGRVLCWGDNARGQLGQGDTAPRQGPVEVPLPGGEVVDLVSNFNHTFARYADGRLVCWGDDFESQCGVGFGPDTQPTPVVVGSSASWADVASGQGHSCGVRRDGTLWCWGRNTQGMSGNDPAVAGRQVVDARQVGSASDWLAVSATQTHTCGLRDTGALHCFGDNLSGQLAVDAPDFSDRALDTGLRDIVDVSTGTFSSCALDAMGRVSCWGRNIEGQLGADLDTDRARPTAIVGGERPVRHLEVGRFHACVIDARGRSCCTGENADGRLGLGDRDRRDTFTCP